ncbi:hypothetical protein ZWY2020_055598 [Hordeum vulgare]|nr:hypothetical protein ZWY2020_055598 [Hordeum vulgare]
MNYELLIIIKSAPTIRIQNQHLHGLLSAVPIPLLAPPDSPRAPPLIRPEAAVDSIELPLPTRPPRPRPPIHHAAAAAAAAPRSNPSAFLAHRGHRVTAVSTPPANLAVRLLR